jgi:polysaccharide chain length determinant protein (PEP-CTERM system associated)
VKPIVNEDLNQRLATMKQQILSRTRLEPIIQDFGLYKKDQEKLPMEELVGRLRKTITVTLVESMTETRNQVPGFTVTVVSDNPRLAQQICTQVTSMFIEESAKTMEQLTTNTTDFITRQLAQAKVKLDEQDSKLATFKRQFMGSLPEDEAANLNLLNGLNTQLEATTQALSRAQQEKAFAESMLSQQLAAWQSTTTEKSPLTLEMQLNDLQNQLVSMEARYTEDYPDVIKLKNNIAQLKRKIADTHTADAQRPAAAPKDAIEPPNIQQLRAQIHQNDLVIKDKTVQQEQVQAQIRTYQGRISLSPSVEQQYKELTRDYQSSLDNYNDLLKKQTQSQIGKDLETQQQGEQFQVLDPASLPESPTFPDHKLFGMGGLAGGLVIGVGIVLVMEMRDNTLRTERDVEFFLKVPTLAMVPALELQGAPVYGRGGGYGKKGKGFGNGNGSKYKNPDNVVRPSPRDRVGMRS